ncbi:MAG: restriction endonuclease [Magnetococcus sp. YQC-3]
MAISLTEVTVIPELANLLYRFLPRSRFENEARKVGVGEYCQGDNKTKAIENLLEHTLSDRRHLFEPLIVRIVSSGKQYCLEQKNPIHKEEILKLNGLIQKIGFKFPHLWDPKFLNSLEPSPSAPSSSKADADHRPDPIQVISALNLRDRLSKLREKFYELYSQQNRQQAGLDLEKLLGELFELYALEPGGSFRVPGEQIDGSFRLGDDIYLVEVKWLSQPVSEGDLLIFRGKVEGKYVGTRGIFIAINGFSDQARQSITQGKQPNFLLMDGDDLTVVLEGNCRLDDLLRAKVRYGSEKGRVFISARKLLEDGRIGMGTS